MTARAWLASLLLTLACLAFAGPSNALAVVTPTGATYYYDHHRHEYNSASLLSLHASPGGAPPIRGYDRPSNTAEEGRASPRFRPATKGEGRVLYHYTSEAGDRETGRLNASQGARRARYGPGQ